jgi:hypothetical protein
MFNHDELDQNQFVISYELLAFLMWLIEHEDKAIARLVKRAFNGGLKQEIDALPRVHDAQLAEEAQQTIVNFFNILESHVLEAMHEDTVQHALAKNLLPTIDQIDVAACDTHTMRKSIEKAAYAESRTQEQAKELLCKELLRHWKPDKKQLMN